MDIKFEDLIPKSKTLKYKGKEIEFKTPDVQNSIKLINLLPKFEQFDIIEQEEFYEVLSYSTGIEIETLKKFSVGFKLKALNILFELIDLDFFVDGLIGMTETMKKFTEIAGIPNQMNLDLNSSEK